MNFVVHATDPRSGELRVAEQSFSGDARYEVRDCGVLTVTSEGTKRTYAPGAWVMVEDSTSPPALGRRRLQKRVLGGRR